MGMNDHILNWLMTYFDGRQQLVKIDNSTISQPIDVYSGVGQEYQISATLFNLFIYDLVLCVKKASTYLYADDGKLAYPINPEDDCKSLQLDLNRVNNYFCLNKLKLNIAKTQSITFHRRYNTINFIYTIDGQNIQKVKTVKDLGILTRN